jgi:hypothetical protein
VNRNIGDRQGENFGVAKVKFVDVFVYVDVHSSRIGNGPFWRRVGIVSNLMLREYGSC